MEILQTSIIDRRKNGKGKSTGNRQKFIRRARDQIKKAVKDAIEKKKVKDIVDDEHSSVAIPTKGISEPNFRHGKGGDRDFVLPGNHDKIVGDTIPKPKGGPGGSGPNASPDGEGEDDFIFTLTRDEFLDFFFEDLELPDLIKTQLKNLESYKLQRAGLTTTGMPANLNIIRSMRNAFGRQIALQAPYIEKIEELENKLRKTKSEAKKKEILEEIEEQEKEKNAVPFIDDVDIRYNSFEKRPNPTTQAVMFCLMDVSGSMGEYEKDLAKRFFMLLYIFLERHYEKIDIVFVRHHTTAEECNEKEFFYGKETGGTIVSSCLKKMAEIVRDRYNTSDWNIYAAQASDGDNWQDDGDLCVKLLDERIMPVVQYFAYVQVGRDQTYHQIWHNFDGDKPLWKSYVSVAGKYKNFAMDQIDNAKDIYPVFRELFKKKEA